MNKKITFSKTENNTRFKTAIAKCILLLLLVLGGNSSWAVTYYLQNANVAAASTPGSWTTNSLGTGGGTAATSFTAGNGNIFNTISGQSATFASSITIGSSGASGTGIVINIVSGSTATINTGVTITLNGKNGNNSEFNVDGTVIFGATAKISLNDNDSRNQFNLTSGATLRTANVLGILGTNSSVEKTAGASPTAAFSTGANYEFNGAGQTMTGIPATVENLTFSGSGAKTYSVVTTVSGDFTMSGSATATPTMTTVGGNVSISGTAVMTTGANNTVTGSLTVGTGATLRMGGFTLGIGGTSSVTGTVNTITSATGLKTFTGAVTINSGGVWDLSTTNTTTSFAGGITMSGTTFNNGTGAAAFSANQSLAGANNMTFGGTITPATSITLTNNNTGTVTVSSTGSIVLTGNFTQGTNSNLTLAANTPFSGAGTFNASSNTNTVTYTGTSVAIRPTTYSSLTINGSGTATIGTATTVNATMTVTSATTNNSTLTVTGALSGAGTLTQGASSVLNLGGTSGITGLNASTNANTVNYTGAAQTVKAVAYSALTFSGSGNKTIATGTSVAGNLTITSIKADVGTGLSINVNNLTLGTSGTNLGTWGSTSSGATYTNNTYFTATNGVLNVAANSSPTPTVTPTVGTYTYTGLLNGPNSATNTGTGTSYTFSYNGTGGTTYGPSATQPTNAGTYTVTVTVAASTDGFYRSASSSATAFSIGARALTITANNGSKTYGQTYTVGSGSTAFTSSGLQNGETIGTITIASTGAVNTAAATTHPIVPSAATGGTFTASNYSITYTNGTLTVNQAPLTITANNGSKTYGQTYTVGSGSTAFTPTGLQNSETIGSITIASTGAVNTATVGSYSIVPSAATGGTFTASNYNITYTNGTLTVNQANLTITANNGTKVYGTTQSTPISGSAAFGSTGLQNGETIGSVTLTYGSGALAATDAVGSTSTITASAATGGSFTASNYNITYTPNSGTLTVTAANLTITANNGSKTYGQTYTVGSGSTAFTSSGLQNSETIGSITIASTGAVNTAAVGSYSIVPSAATGGTFTASNYNITYNNGTLTVNQTPLTITANNGSKTYGQTYTVGSGSTAFTPTGLQNGETVGTITIASTGAVNTAAVGSYNIVPSAATGGTFTASNYNITYTNGTLTVNQANLTITANNGTKVYGTTQSTPVTGATTFGSTGLQNGETIATVTLTYGSGALAATDAVGSTSTITASAATGGTFTAGNYNITYTPNSGTLTVTAANLTITADNGTKVYGTTQSTPVTGATTFGSTGLQNGETIGSVTLTYGSGALAATDAVGSTSTITASAATGGTFTAGNYNITYTPNSGTLTVTAANLTITANNGTKVYGTTQSTPVTGATTFGSTGLQNGETIGSVTLAYGSGALAATDAVGSTSTITPSAAIGGTFTASNYNITYTPNSGTLTVTAANLTITANNGTKVYGTTQSTPVTGATTFGSTGLQNGETIGSVTLTYGLGALAATDAVGSTSTITASAAIGGTFTASNYNITYTPNSGTLTVTAAPLTITADNASKCYGTTYTLGTTAFTSVGLQNSETIGSVTLNSSGAISSAAAGSYAIVPSAATGGTFTASNYNITYTDGNLTVNALPAAPTGTDGERCSTGTVGISASVSGGETVDWYDASSGGTLLLSNSTSYTTPSISSTTIYYAEARNTTTGCVSSARTAVTATVYPTSVGGTVSSDQTICSGTQPADLTLASNVGSVIKWQSSSDVGFTSPTDILVASTTLTGTDIGNLTATTYFRAVVQSGTCSSANSSAVLITVDAVSVGGTVSANQSICYNTEPADLTLSGETGDVVKWQSSSDVGFTSPTDIAETSTTLSGVTIGPLTTNTYFRAVVQSGVCSVAYSASVLISIDAITVGGSVAANQTICSGTQPADLNLSGNTGSVVRWESSIDISFTSPTNILVTSTTLTGATIGNLTQDTYFRAIVQNGSCDEEESAAVLISVDDAPIAGIVDGGTAICAGSTSGLLTLTGQTGTVDRWEYSVSPFTSWTTIVNTNDTYTSGVITETTQFRAVIQNGVCPEVYSVPTSVDVNTVTYASGAWAPGAPDATTAAVIASNYTSTGSIEACSLTVNNGATVVISSGDTVTLSGALTANVGSFVTFNNNANLIQSGSTNTNTGAIIIKRSSSPLYRLDYTLWSSPVANQKLKAFSPGTVDNRFYTHDTPTNAYVVVPSPSTTDFATAKGYLIRMPNSWPAFVPPTDPDPQVPGGTSWTGSFTGVPNNGDYGFTLVDGGSATLRYNSVGNPYPSPIDATAFVTNPTNFANTTATLYFLRKTNYYSARSSYSTWNTAGYTDNGEPGRTLDGWDGVIQPGQGFFVEASGIGSSLVFDNSMRIDNHDNQLFFKNGHTPSTTSIERNRIWLNATNTNGLFSQTMVGYMANATQGVDAAIDAKYFNDGDIALTSSINDVPYAIQGRALPFDANDVVPLNFKVTTAGNYTIAIDHVDGLFTGGTQSIYLKDNLTTTLHDLNTGAYSFATTAGTFANRFEIVYALPLGVGNLIFSANNVIIYNQNNDFVVNTGNVIMSSIKVFDISGRLLQERKDINAGQTTIATSMANEVLLFQITTEDGVTVTKKVIR